jgi:nitroreductase
MDLYEAIERRRTIRVFKAAATEEQLKKIILAGTKSPSAVNKQPWEFVLVNDPALIDRIATIKYELTMKNALGNAEDTEALKKRALDQKDSFNNASIVAVCNLVEWERSVWMCMENISLAAVAEGLGSGIVLFWDEEKHKVGELIGLPHYIEVTAIMKIGVPAENGFDRENNPYAPRRQDFSWLHQNRFGKNAG